MTESYRLHEVHIHGRGTDPADAYSVESTCEPDGVRLLVLAGELDMAAVPAVRTRVDEAAGTRGLVIDLAGVTFMDSSMLKELLRAAAELHRYETRLVLAGVVDAVQRLLELTKATGLFTLAPDREAALAQ